jgi:hypothetical protein
MRGDNPGPNYCRVVGHDDDCDCGVNPDDGEVY